MDVVKALVEKGVPFPDYRGNPLLTALGENAPTSILEYMIYRGAPVNGTSESGMSPLIKAVQCKNIEIIETLLKCGAFINHQTKEGNSALMSAVWTWHPDMIKIVNLLIKWGCNLNLVNKRGKTALMVAVGVNIHTSFPTPFMKHEIDPMVLRRKIVTILLNEGISVGSCDINGNYPLDTATQESCGFGDDKEVPTMLFVAGGCASQGQIPQALNALSEDEVPTLQHVCRDMIRDQLMLNNTDSNLFKIVPKIQLPVPIQSFLLYGVELKQDDIDSSNKGATKLNLTRYRFSWLEREHYTK